LWILDYSKVHSHLVSLCHLNINTATENSLIMAPQPAVRINSSTLPNPLPIANPDALSSSIKPLPQQTVSLLSSALMSTNGTTRIEAALTQELSQSGWMAAVRNMVTALVRSGECTTYEEVMGRVRSAIRIAGGSDIPTSGSKKGSAAANGVDAAALAKLIPEGVGSVVVPQEVLTHGLKLVRTEVEKVCDFKVDDVDG
jgi:hypothetical protein